MERKMKRIMAAALTLALFTCLIGCRNFQARKLLGEWEEIENSSHTLKIEKNGDHFLVSEYRNDQLQTGGPTPATFQDGVLTLPERLGTAPTIYFDKQSRKLVMRKGLGPFSSQTEFIRKKK